MLYILPSHNADPAIERVDSQQDNASIMNHHRPEHDQGTHSTPAQNPSGHNAHSSGRCTHCHIEVIGAALFFAQVSFEGPKLAEVDIAAGGLKGRIKDRFRVTAHNIIIHAKTQPMNFAGVKLAHTSYSAHCPF